MHVAVDDRGHGLRLNGMEWAQWAQAPPMGLRVALERTPAAAGQQQPGEPTLVAHPAPSQLSAPTDLTSACPGRGLISLAAAECTASCCFLLSSASEFAHTLNSFCSFRSSFLAVAKLRTCLTRVRSPPGSFPATHHPTSQLTAPRPHTSRPLERSSDSNSSARTTRHRRLLHSHCP